MAYYSEGAFSWDVLYTMPIPLRRFNMYKLKEAKEKENEEYRKIAKKSKISSIPSGLKSIPRPSMPSIRKK